MATSPQGHQYGGGHAARAPASPPPPPQAASDAAGAPPPPPLGPNGGRAPSGVAISVYTAAAAAARQGQHGRDLVPSGSSLLAAVQAQAGGLQGRARAPELDSAHLPAPLPLYIDRWTLIAECRMYMFFTVFGF